MLETLIRRLWPMLAPLIAARLAARLKALALRVGVELSDDDALSLAAMIVEAIADLLDGVEKIDAATARKATALIASMREPT